MRGEAQRFADKEVCPATQAYREAGHIKSRVKGDPGSKNIKKRGKNPAADHLIYRILL